ncbi:hypothetical protein M569_10139 [Genlisea aurea]|uniref:Nucleotide-diphospho-sugar transferase domain-containing protein n=1 Tax=Genlisea aurea TaxID=192259 RepID=S8DXE6_9LAMI|nr:hypothetical protein M569_10139 [Genlisea aurea]
MYVKSNHKTIDFLTLWFKAHHRFPGKRLQQVLAVTKFHPTVDRVGLRMRFLDTVNFGGLCEPQNDIDLIVTMHTQCCTGMAAKINDMNVAIDDWKRYRNNGANKKWSMGKRKCGRKKEEEQLPYRQIHR